VKDDVRRVIIRDESGSKDLFLVRTLIAPLQGGVVWGRGPGAARSLAPGYFMSPLWGFWTNAPLRVLWNR